MKFLVVGLGSMGKRRVRCLKALNYKNIIGYDINPKRRKEAKSKYNIETSENFSELIKSQKIDAMIISTSPDFHMEYAYTAFEKNIPFFIEASVTNEKKIKKLSQLCSKYKRLAFPSCTMIFNDSFRKVKEIIQKKLIGKIYFAKYHVGQYLPDWHPWESIKNFYVGKKETNGCKELIPFELTWINNLFGKPTILNVEKKKFSNLDINFYDFYDLGLKYPKNIFFNLTIEILSRPIATRELLILGSLGKIILSFDQKVVKYKNTKMQKFKTYPFNSGKIIKGYINSERPYISEIRTFIKAVKKRNSSLFPNTLENDFEILRLTSKLLSK